MNLTNEQIEANKQRFLQLISQVDIPGADIAGLVNFLTTSDFFTCPSSTQYHCNFEGGNCYHSLNVYDILDELCEKYFPGKYDKNSKIICGLLHDISKANFYEKYIQNKKIYNEHGSKSDNQGKFDWFAEEAYKVKDVQDRFIGGEHGFNSMMIVAQYIPLTFEENLSLLHHHFVTEAGSPIRDISAIYNKYPLCTLLHLADMTACYILERI